MQCLQMLTMKNDSLVRTAQVLVCPAAYPLVTSLPSNTIASTPVEAREASLDPFRR